MRIDVLEHKETIKIVLQMDLVSLQRANRIDLDQPRPTYGANRGRSTVGNDQGTG
jgi:hypothetical protein